MYSLGLEPDPGLLDSYAAISLVASLRRLLLC
jgi:hypothetical protein